jgi:hypothetical protein
MCVKIAWYDIRPLTTDLNNRSRTSDIQLVSRTESIISTRQRGDAEVTDLVDEKLNQSERFCNRQAQETIIRTGLAVPMLPWQASGFSSHPLSDQPMSSLARLGANHTSCLFD